MIYQSEKRNALGQSGALMGVLAVFVVGVLGMFAYESAHLVLGRQQLKTCLDSAALTAACTTASSNSSDALATQQAAMATALNMFQQNSILGRSLSNAAQASSLPLNPGPNQAQLYFQFLDPVTLQVVPLGSPNGKIMQVLGAFGVVPSFANYVGLGSNYVIQDSSCGGLPMLDVVLCFDISASMDDFTNISIVDRYWNGTSDAYNVIAQGPLYSAFQCTNPTGTGVNATFPQELDSSGSGGEGIYSFNESDRGTNNGAKAPSGKATVLTDLVVNIDGTTNESAGTTISYNGSSFYFPANNVGVLVEAARGNLESKGVADAAGVPYASWGVTPQTGYFQAYLQTAFGQRHPIYDAIIAAQNFFSILVNDADVHFGLVTFASGEGTSASSVIPDDITGNIANSYVSNADPTDPLNPKPPNPLIQLNPAAGSANSNFSQVTSAVAPVRACGGTDIAGALYRALNQILPASQGGQGLSRAGSNKVVVLFTDGLPNRSTVPGDSDPTTAARDQAARANAAGIPIYCIGLCLVPTLQAAQTAMLTDANSNPQSGGIAGISGNGAVFYQTTSSAELSKLFENLARNLCQLVKG
jgi:hypothetical protein